MAGGGVALLRARQAAGAIKGDNADQEAGIKLVLKAIEAPLREIVYNAGGEPSVVVNAVLAGKGNHGFNAANDTYGDMIEMGILDPTKVTRTALQNAASVASLMLTTECMVSESPKDDAPAGGGMPDMGGMGGMGHGHVIAPPLCLSTSVLLPNRKSPAITCGAFFRLVSFKLLLLQHVVISSTLLT